MAGREREVARVIITNSIDRIKRDRESEPGAGDMKALMEAIVYFAMNDLIGREMATDLKDLKFIVSNVSEAALLISLHRILSDGDSQEELIERSFPGSRQLADVFEVLQT